MAICKFIYRGEGIIEGLCLDYCNQWMKYCFNDLFSIGIKELEFCSGNHLFCYKLSDLVSDGTEMCNKMGFSVREADCYNGISASVKKGPAPVVEPSNNYSFYAFLVVLLISSILAIVYKQYFQKIGIDDIREIRMKRFTK